MAKPRAKVSKSRPAKRPARSKTKPTSKPKVAAKRLELDAPIVPGTSAAGVAIWQPIDEVLAFAKPNKVDKLGGEMTSYAFDAVKLWTVGGLITQIGLTKGYRGALDGVRVGAPATALAALGDVGTDEDTNTVVDGLVGVVFDAPEERIDGIYVTALGEYEDTNDDD